MPQPDSMTTPTATVSAAPQVGELAPDFTLPSTEGRDVTLSSLRGERSVLLAFFPLAFTSTCTAEMCAFGDDYDAFASKQVVVFPISVDSVPTLKEYKAKYAMQVELLSDFRREVCKLYDVFLEERFYSKRAYFLIDREGIVRWAHVEKNPSHRRENAEILEQIARL